MNDSTCFRRSSRAIWTALALGMVLTTPSPLHSARKERRDPPKPPVASPTLSAQDRAVYEQRIAAHDALGAEAQTHAVRIGYIEALLHLGQPRQAIDELYRIEAVFPGSYLNAMYLGQAHEMLGNFESARYWVAEGWSRNPDARKGSEWLHLAIVEAQSNLAKDPQWLETHSILENNTHRSAEDILAAIETQLALRVEFGLPENLVVSDLYFEAGVCVRSQAGRRAYFARSLQIDNLRRTQIDAQDKLQSTVVTSADF